MKLILVNITYQDKQISIERNKIVLELPLVLLNMALILLSVNRHGISCYEY